MSNRERSAVVPAPAADGPDDDAVPRGTLRNQVMIRLLTAVFEGRFKAGERLVVRSLAELYRVSPTPVREALVELDAFGVVRLLPNRGAVVLPFGPQQAREIVQIRRVLEVEAIRCACGRIDPGALEAIEAELQRLRSTPWDDRRDRNTRSVDNRLHGMIAGSCGSARLASEIGRYLMLYRVIRDLHHCRDARTNYSHSDDVLEHLEIVGALKSGDAERAAAAMDWHIRATAARLEQVLFANWGRDGEATGEGRSA